MRQAWATRDESLLSGARHGLHELSLRHGLPALPALAEAEPATPAEALSTGLGLVKTPRRGGLPQ